MPLVKYEALLNMDKGDTGRAKINTKESSLSSACYFIAVCYMKIASLLSRTQITIQNLCFSQCSCA